MSLWVQFNYRRVAQSDLPPYWFFRRVSLACELPQHSSRVSQVLVKRGQGCQANKQESPNSLFFPGVQIGERSRQIHEEKMRGDNLTRSPLTAALYYLNAWMEQAM